MLNEDFTNAKDVQRYTRFTDAMVDLVLSHEGTLKAEHGTGRVMAPFVRKQYGDELYQVMSEIKSLFDPQNTLNPGVIISDDSELHVKNLKITPTVESEVDRCVECGYCEPVCPSKNLTLTPRQRIVIRREMESAKSEGNITKYNALKKDYGYDSLDTCAVDGMCSTACPVLINTGDLVKRLREEEMPAVGRVGWTILATTWGLATSAISIGLKFAKFAPMPKGLRLPRGGSVREPIYTQNPDVIYFPSCTTSMFDSSVRESFLSLCAKAGINVSTPDGINGLCCGQPWKSKGATDGYNVMKDKTADWLREATQGGKIPVISDASSCTEALRKIDKTTDVVEFVAEKILPRINVKKISSIAVHPTCSSVHLGSTGALYTLARAMSDEVFTPKSWNCCAFAGDRGIIKPELTESATEVMSAEINEKTYSAYVSNNRTCEIGISRGTGKPYRHIIEQLAEQVQ